MLTALFPNARSSHSVPSALKGPMSQVILIYSARVVPLQIEVLSDTFGSSLTHLTKALLTL